jgi:hypothetical protein
MNDIKTAHGQLDNIESHLCWARHQVAAFLQNTYASSSACGRCQFPWPVVRGHSTAYDPSSGCFPLCEGCWQELQTPENRMPYYMALVDWWEREARRWNIKEELAKLPERRIRIRDAVLAER